MGELDSESPTEGKAVYESMKHTAHYTDWYTQAI